MGRTRKEVFLTQPTSDSLSCPTWAPWRNYGTMSSLWLPQVAQCQAQEPWMETKISTLSFLLALGILLVIGSLTEPRVPHFKFLSGKASTRPCPHSICLIVLLQWRIQTRTDTPGILQGAGDLNSGPRVCIASTPTHRTSSPGPSTVF